MAIVHPSRVNAHHPSLGADPQYLDKIFCGLGGGFVEVDFDLFQVETPFRNSRDDFE